VEDGQVPPDRLIDAHAVNHRVRGLCHPSGFCVRFSWLGGLLGRPLAGLKVLGDDGQSVGGVDGNAFVVCRFE
jgi:hypothetical protein